MSETAEPKKTSVADDESKRWRKGKGAAHRVEERAQAAYTYILEGGTRIEVAQKVVSRFNCSLRTAHDDYKRAMTLLREEQQGTREELLNQLQVVRSYLAPSISDFHRQDLRKSEFVLNLMKRRFVQCQG